MADLLPLLVLSPNPFPVHPQTTAAAGSRDRITNPPDGRITSRAPESPTFSLAARAKGHAHAPNSRSNPAVRTLCVDNSRSEVDQLEVLRIAPRQTVQWMQSSDKRHTSTRTSSSSTGSGTDSWTTDFLETDFLGVADVLFLGAALFFSATGLSTLTSASRSTDGSGVFSLSSSSIMLARLARVDELARVDLCGPGNNASVSACDILARRWLVFQLDPSHSSLPSPTRGAKSLSSDSALEWGLPPRLQIAPPNHLSWACARSKTFTHHHQTRCFLKMGMPSF
jgi:hypothetical protein